MTNTQTYLACLAACGLWAAAPTSADSAPFDTFKDCDVCPEMIELPLGEFMMGAPERELQQRFELMSGEWRQTDLNLPQRLPYGLFPRQLIMWRTAIDFSIMGLAGTLRAVTDTSMFRNIGLGS